MSTPDLSQCAWRKSSWSTSEANCVEVASTLSVMAVRDSKNPDGPTLAFPVSSWTAFLPR